jgi:hypothetical protein
MSNTYAIRTSSRLARYVSAARDLHRARQLARLLPHMARARQWLAGCATTAEGKQTAFALPPMKVMKLVARLHKSGLDGFLCSVRA